MVNQAILVLEGSGPAEGRPLVDTVTASRLANMKELRPPSGGRSEVRILFVFDPWWSAVRLVAGDKRGSGRSGTGHLSRKLSSCTRITWLSGRRR